MQVTDIVDRRAVDGMVRAANAAFGSIDILVCNASSRGQIDFLEMDHATWRRVIDISLDGTFHCAQATLPGMIAKGWGRIITLGGISWHAGFKRRAHNLAGKSGLTGLTRALAVEFGDRGITANVIAPGSIETVRPASAGTLPPGPACRRCRGWAASMRSPQRRCSSPTRSRATSPARSFTSTAGPISGRDAREHVEQLPKPNRCHPGTCCRDPAISKRQSNRRDGSRGQAPG